MPAAERRWSAREVRALIEESPLASPRYELVDGELLVTPSPGYPHQRAVARLLVALHEYARAEGIGEALASPFDVELEPETITQPDIFVISPDEGRRMQRDGLPSLALLLTVEVLSPGSSRHDRVRKRPLYQRHVPEYWIIDLDARIIERWRTSEDRPEIIETTLEWRPDGTAEPFMLDVERFFAEVMNEQG
ncbi:MAG TPA: Uma2 family endonuclease [Gemmatimonadaceae bacterium]|nr:Uma2 family endonuclease [Gemmatimonadaceae bacterium]